MSDKDGYKAVTFDLDGVLIDMVDIHHAAFADAVYNVSRYVLPEKYHQEKLNGLPTRVKLAMLVERENIWSYQVEAIFEAKQHFTNQLAQEAIQPEVEKLQLLNKLRSNGYRLACVSNCIQTSVYTLLNLAGLLDCFDELVSNEDVSRAKPYPDPYLCAMTRLKVDPSEVVSFEDSPVGLESVKAAGVIKPVQIDYPDVNIDFISNIEGLNII